MSEAETAAKGALFMNACCSLSCMGGILALWGIYAFANPDMGYMADTTPPMEYPNLCYTGFEPVANPVLSSVDLSGSVSSSSAGLNIGVTLQVGSLAGCTTVMWNSADGAYRDPTEDEQNMTAQFMDLFLAQFILALCPLAAVLLAGLAAATKVPAIATPGGLIVPCAGCASLAWVIAAAVIRWGYGGQAIAGVAYESNVQPETQEEWDANNARGYMMSSGLLLHVIVLLDLIGPGVCIVCVCVATCALGGEAMKERG